MSVFWYHYNKPESKKFGKPKLTVHYKGKCILVDGIICKAPTYSHNRKQQPYLVIKGNAKKFDVVNAIAMIE